MTDVNKDVEFVNLDGESTPDADDVDDSLRYKGVGTSSYYPTGVYLAENVQNTEENIYSKTSYDYVDRSQVYYEEPTLEATTADYVYVTENCTQPRHQPEEKDFAEHHCSANFSSRIPRVFLAIAISVIIATAVVFTLFAFSLFALKEDIKTMSDRLSDLRTRFSEKVNMISSLNESIRTMSGDVDLLHATARDFHSSLQTIKHVLNDTNATFQVVGIRLQEVKEGAVRVQDWLNDGPNELNSFKMELDYVFSHISSLEDSVQNLENK